MRTASPTSESTDMDTIPWRRRLTGGAGLTPAGAGARCWLSSSTRSCLRCAVPATRRFRVELPAVWPTASGPPAAVRRLAGRGGLGGARDGHGEARPPTGAAAAGPRMTAGVGAATAADWLKSCGSPRWPTATWPPGASPRPACWSWTTTRSRARWAATLDRRQQGRRVRLCRLPALRPERRAGAAALAGRLGRGRLLPGGPGAPRRLAPGRQLDPATAGGFTATLAATGADPGDYLWLPVHDWQWEHVVVPAVHAQPGRRRPWSPSARGLTSTCPSSRSAP